MRAFFSKKEELWNTWSHAAGIAMGVGVGIAFIIFCHRHCDSWADVGIALYLFGMLGSYITSTAYHALPPTKRAKAVLRRWDHAAIYWHIAGSYSPITLIALRQQGFWGWGLFCFVWLCAIIGTFMSFRNLKEHSNLETLCFIGMGLSVLVAFKPLAACVSSAAIFWIVGEGVFYIVGAIFYTLHRRPYTHSVFHFFVLAGSICHILAVWDVLLSFFN